MKKIQKRILIKQKLLFINAVVAILPVLVFAIFINQIYEDVVHKRIRQNVQDTTAVIVDRITKVLKDAENCSNYLTVNINRIIGTKSKTKEISLAEQKSITNELYVAKIVFDEIESIAFINVDNDVYVSDYTTLINLDAILESEQLEKLKETSGASIWFYSEARDFLVKDVTESVLTLGKKVVQINTGETLGYIFLNVDIGVIESNLDNQLINYQLIYEDKSIVSSIASAGHINKDDLAYLIETTENNQIYKFNGRKYYMYYYDILDYDSRLISITDINEFNVEANDILYMGLAIAIVVIFIEILLSNYLSRIITVPLLKLKTGAEEIAGGNMRLRLNFKSHDEIGKLGSSFNYMAEQVQELLVKVNYEAKKRREYELSLLQEQVKPHFLYNSLDIVIKLLDMNRSKEAKKTVRRLVDYYRNSLSDSNEIISVSQEIDIVIDYLELQKIRYNDLFTYEISVDNEILHMLIPKLTLQPLIENSIYHGIKYKDEQGLIRISGKKSKEGMVLTVEDNGAGMNQDYCDRLLQYKLDGHFGIFSVNHRIKLLFGGEYGMVVKSEVKKGTRIDIILPAKESMDRLA
ncbi:MAG: HAMP domain-containing protein [Anaerolineaceae bacterium]|nr:MAG: HAMP domain-containing protein [Anaerolineaceae bacterium]